MVALPRQGTSLLCRSAYCDILHFKLACGQAPLRVSDCCQIVRLLISVSQTYVRGGIWVYSSPSIHPCRQTLQRRTLHRTQTVTSTLFTERAPHLLPRVRASAFCQHPDIQITSATRALVHQWLTLHNAHHDQLRPHGHGLRDGLGRQVSSLSLF